FDFDKQSFKDKEFINCTFLSCVFLECIFQTCTFNDCVFQKCDLSLAKLPNTRLMGVEFKRSKLVGINWLKTKMFSRVNFRECLINNCSFLSLNLTKIALIKCQVKDTSFAETNLSYAKCGESDFEKSIFLNTNLTGADFSAAINYNINPHQNKLKKAKFSLPDAINLLENLEITLT
ncbi:pentapeptide repeat-containing protein, partial [bacterium]|nr:pentapeptide repeat-containing protein [bacterium]